MAIEFDAVAALRCWAVTVDLGGRPYRIEPRPAAAWMAAILDDAWDDIVPGWCDDQDDALDDALTSGEVTMTECIRAAQDAVAVAAGARWWVAARIITAGTAGGTLGEILLSGIDPERRPLGAVVQAMYRALVRHADKNDRTRLDLELDRPPPGTPAAERFDADAASAAFDRAASARGGE